MSELAADFNAFRINDQRAMRALAAAEDRHFWHTTRNEFIVDRLAKLGAPPPATVLELGCGSGSVAAHLSGACYRVTGVEGHRSLLVRAALRAPNAQFVVHDLARGVAPIAHGDFDVVGLFDVIEHLDDRRGALIEALSAARVGGLVVGTVPALMALWTDVDVQAGHRLRYDARGLRTEVAVKGAEVIEVIAFNRVLVPMLWAQRRLLTLRKRPVGATSEKNFAVPPQPLNGALRALVRAEQRLAPVLDSTRVPGSSLWFAVRRVA